MLPKEFPNIIFTPHTKTIIPVDAKSFFPMLFESFIFPTVVFIIKYCIKKATLSAATVPIQAPTAPKDGINNAFNVTLVTALKIYDIVNAFV